MLKHLTGGDWGKNKGKDVGKCTPILSLAGAEDSKRAVKVDKSDKVARYRRVQKARSKS